MERLNVLIRNLPPEEGVRALDERVGELGWREDDISGNSENEGTISCEEELINDDEVLNGIAYTFEDFLKPFWDSSSGTAL